MSLTTILFNLVITAAVVGITCLLTVYSLGPTLQNPRTEKLKNIAIGLLCIIVCGIEIYFIWF